MRRNVQGLPLKGCTRGKLEERKWQQLFEDPSTWLDQRQKKKNGSSPDFKQPSTGKALWLDSFFCPEWVIPKLKGLVIRTEESEWHGKESLEAYRKMREEGVRPSVATVLGVLKVCSSLKDVESGKRVHADVIANGDDANIFVASTLVDMYCKCGRMRYAEGVFDKMELRDVVTWNCMMMGYVQNGEGETALEVFARMRDEGECEPNRVTFLAALKAYGSMGAGEALGPGKDSNLRGYLYKGKEIHYEVRKRGFMDMFMASSIVDMYCKCGSMADASNVFWRMPQHDVVCWSSMMTGHAQNDEATVALRLFECMQEGGYCRPDARIYVAALRACASLAKKGDDDEWLQKGRLIHSQLMKSGEVDRFVASALVAMYSKCKSLREAHEVFNRMPYHDLVSLSSLMLGYATCGDGDLALQLFKSAEEVCVPDAATFAAAVKACGCVAALECGRLIHAQVMKAGAEIQTDSVLVISLIDMYGKCGSMVEAQKVFDESSSKRDVVGWNVLMSGYSRKGDTKCVFEVFEKMRKERVKANELTFLSLLSACSHAGLVAEGKECFELMKSKEYSVIPTLEHYTCMVDLLSRANELDNAVEMVKRMPYEANMRIWTTLLGACQKWSNVVVGKFAFESAIGLDNKDSTPYVLMANIFSVAPEFVEFEKNLREYADVCSQA